MWGIMAKLPRVYASQPATAGDLIFLLGAFATPKLKNIIIFFYCNRTRSSSRLPFEIILSELLCVTETGCS